VAYSLLTLWLCRLATLPRPRRRPRSPDGLAPRRQWRPLLEKLEDRLPPNNLLAGGFSPFSSSTYRPNVLDGGSALSAPGSTGTSSPSDGGALLSSSPGDGSALGGGNLGPAGPTPTGDGSPGSDGPSGPSGSSGTSPAVPPSSGSAPVYGPGASPSLPSDFGGTTSDGGSSSSSGSPFFFNPGQPQHGRGPGHGPGPGHGHAHGHTPQGGHGHGRPGGHHGHGHPGAPTSPPVSPPASPPTGGGTTTPPTGSGSSPGSPNSSPPTGGDTLSKHPGSGSGVPTVPGPVTSTGPITDTTLNPGDFTEEDITVNPNNPNQLFVGTNANDVFFGMEASWSDDGGATWHSRVIADGLTDNLPVGFSDPTVAWDTYGNLFYGWVDGNNLDQNDIVLSTDGGQSFQPLASVRGVNDTFVLDQPSLAVGPGPGGVGQSLWITNADVGGGGSPIYVFGAPILGLGQVGAFKKYTITTNPGNFGDIAVGPKGQVTVYWEDNNGTGPGNLYAATDPTGLNGSFGAPVVVTRVQTLRYPAKDLPSMPDRGATMKGAITYDRSPGPHNGRAYLIYANSTVNLSADTNIYLRYSDDNGKTWSAPTKINDDTSGRTHILPRVAVDQTTGSVGASWYDARNDNGDLGPGDTDGVPNTDLEMFASASFDGGSCWLPNIQLTPYASSAKNNPNFTNDYGDYTGLAFADGVMHPVWADNSASLADNTPPTWNVGSVAVSVPTIPTLSDVYEPNETSDKAHKFGPLRPSALPTLYEYLQIANHPNGFPDYDWFRWTATTNGLLTVRFGVVQSTGTLEMHVFTVNGDGTLVQIGQMNLGGGTCDFTHLFTANVRRDEPILLEFKGANSSLGVHDQGTYDFMIGLTS
jgi:hypothetical protein